MSAQSVAPPAMRPALKYYGSKVALAGWLISHFPPHAHYCEPFGGGGAVLLAKEPSALETYNDLDDGVVTFFRVLRERPADLVRAIELTPFAKAEFELSYLPADDDLERARRFYVRSWQARSGGQWRAGWRRVKNPAQNRTIDTWQPVDHLYAIAARLRRVQIEQDDALKVVRRYDRPDTLFYCDPPYPASTRGRWAKTGYAVEMTDDDHRRLAETLHGVAGMVVLSGYDCDLYRELYPDWRSETRATTTDGGFSRVEVLWLNAAAARGGRQPRLLEVL